MRTLLVIAAVAMQIVLLACMAGEREFVVRTGQTVYLRTRPIDPQDLFRGGCLRLDYDISHVEHSLLRDGLSDISDKKPIQSSCRVYAVLNVADNNPAEMLYLTDKKPKDGIFLRGWLDRRYNWANIVNARYGIVNVRYGIEAYFVEQGSAQKLEQARRREGIPVPLEMEMALGRNGTAVLKGYRFSPLGLGLTPDVKRDPNQPAGRRTGRIQAVTLKLLNASDKPLAIVDLPDGRSFSLESSDRWFAMESWQWVNKDAPRQAADNNNVHVLKPNETCEVRINLTNPAWFVVKEGGGTPIPISELDWNGRFRFVYHPPSGEDCRNLDKANIIWHGYLPSPALFGVGSGD